jgi:hypothetical protein
MDAVERSFIAYGVSTALTVWSNTNLFHSFLRQISLPPKSLVIEENKFFFIPSPWVEKSESQPMKYLSPQQTVSQSLHQKQQKWISFKTL